MRKRIKAPEAVLEDIFFFTIHLTDGQMVLTKEVLDKHYEPVPNGRNAFRDIDTSYVGYAKEIVTVAVTLPKEDQHTLYLHVDAGQIHVGCNCHMPGDRLCRHAYFGLVRLMWFRDQLDLKAWYWPEINSDLKGVNKFLNVKVSSTALTVEPRAAFGNIYRPEVGFEKAERLKFAKQCITEITPVGNKVVLGYALVYSSSKFVTAHLPFLMPFIAVTDRKGNKIKSYKHYVYRGQVPGIKLTHEQIMLNGLCFDMYDIAIGTGKLPEKREFDQWQDFIPILLDLWRKVIPKLHYQTYVKSTQSFGYKNWTNTPRKQYTRDCHVEADKLMISFLLKEHEDHFALELVLKLKNGTLNGHYEKGSLFIHDRSITCLYLVSSPQDERLLNWLDETNNRLTIFKVHFEEFQSQFLERLSNSYPVMLLPLNQKKQRLYQPSDFKE